MTGDGTALGAAAERLLDVPFRLHGRDPSRGLDCVGLVAAALEAVGVAVEAPSAYRLRCLRIAPFLHIAERAGLTQVEDETRAGDVLLVRPGPGQFHLLIAALGGSFVHAHAGLGRVVRMPSPLLWPVERKWRLLAE